MPPTRGRRSVPARLDSKRQRAEEAKERVIAIRSDVFADIKRIRLMWANGNSNQEIQKALRLNWGKWKNRLRIMKAVPPDEDLINAYKRYYAEHEKFVARQEARLQQLSRVRDISYSRIEGERRIITNPEGMERITMDMSEIDDKIRTAEAHLLVVKKNLGIVDGTSGAGASPYSYSNVAEVWRRRRESQQQQQTIDISPTRGSNGERR